MEINFTPLGDCGLRASFPQLISPEINNQVRAFAIAIQKEDIPGIKELVPAYAALSIYYDPAKILYQDLIKKLIDIKEKITDIELPPSRLVKIPVLYGGEKGPDLKYVASYHNLTIEEVIYLHTQKPYLIYMMGFLPGFPYLGGLSEKLATPRLNSPRSKIPGGSVGIGGKQTGIYPVDAPGGWQIIGHTPVKLYDPESEVPVLLRAGDYLQFYEVSEQEYEKIKAKVERGEYALKFHLME